ncbi:MAG TPA: FtsX-like permease family protein [Gammaproteobacteria bacterium]|nr:FtsX-like permease family protein [Gammaproteobacteria bacterium]
MALFLRIAWRNVARNQRRTFITLAAIASGLAAIIVFFGLSNGFHDQWITNSVRVYTGHIVVFAENYRDDRNLNRAISNIDDLTARLEILPGVEAVTPRIHINGLVSTARNSSVAVIRAVDPARETQINGLRERIIVGSYFEDDAHRQILLGYKMAKRLNADPGEKIVLMVQGADGSIGAELFRLQGIFRIGAIDLDGSLAIIGLADGQNLAAMDDKVTEAVLILDSPSEVAATAGVLATELDGSAYEILQWDELLPQAKEMIGLSNVFTYILLVIILIVVSLGILNTMLMSIMERTREFGIMRALGTRPAQIVRLVLLEAICLGVLGVLLGVSLGVAINGFLGTSGIDLSRWSGAMDLISSLKPVIYPTIHPGRIAIAAFAAFLATLLAAIYPALRAARLSPAAAIRSL